MARWVPQPGQSIPKSFLFRHGIMYLCKSKISVFIRTILQKNMILKRVDANLKLLFLDAYLKSTRMKKLLIPIMVVAIAVAFYEVNQPEKNVYILIFAVVIFMFGMMKLSAKTPSKNQEKEEGDV